MSYNYYLDQLNRLDTNNLITVKFYSNNTLKGGRNTNFLNFNDDTLRAINSFFLKKQAIENFKNHCSAICSIWHKNISKKETRMHIQAECLPYLTCLKDIGIITLEEYKVFYEKLISFIYY